VKKKRGLFIQVSNDVEIAPFHRGGADGTVFQCIVPSGEPLLIIRSVNSMETLFF